MILVDNWVVIRMTRQPWQITPAPLYYRLLVGWYSSYLSGDAWQMNSGIVSAEQDGDYFLFHGVSGSLYKTHKERYGLRRNNDYIYSNLVDTWGQEAVSIMPENTDWVNLKWEE